MKDIHKLRIILYSAIAVFLLLCALGYYFSR
jgi:hypothetical protein